MAGLELAAQLAILDDAVTRLEGELARDETWRALFGQPQSDADTASLSAADRAARDARLTRALESNPIYLAWKNMRETADMLRERQAAAGAASVEPAQTADATVPEAVTEAGHRATLAEALQQMSQAEAASDEPALADALPGEIAQIIARQIASQTAPGSARTLTAQQRAQVRAQEQEQHDVGTRATQAVDRILSIPTVDPVVPEKIGESRRKVLAAMAPQPASPQPAPQPAPKTVAPEAAAGPPRQAEDDIGHSVPLEAEDLAFLLSPATRPRASAPPPEPRTAEPSPVVTPEPQPEPQLSAPDPEPDPAPAPAPVQTKPFLERLVAEAQAAPTKASILQPPRPSADPFMIPAAEAPPAAASEPEPAPGPQDASSRAPRLARLLKAWSRH